MDKDKETFAFRNYMVRVLFTKYSHGEARCYAEAWLEQKHPFGYSIDYFDTEESARSAIAADNFTRNDQAGYNHEYVIYKLEVAA
jgi:hypothetical protein